MKRNQSRYVRQSRRVHNRHGQRRTQRSMRRGGTRKSYKSQSNLPLAVGKIFSIHCGHCSAMATDWTALKLKHPTLINDETDIEASEINTKLPALKAKYNIDDIKIDGYPIIYKIIKGPTHRHLVVLYEGPRTTQAMHNWILGKKMV
jgi:hypothetical protein